MNARPSIATLAVVATASVAALCPAEEPARTVAVSGTMVSRIEPDTIAWRIDIEETDEVLANAKGRSDAKVSTVLDLIAGLAVPSEDLQTGYLNARREYDRSLAGNKRFKHWVLRRMIVFKQRDLTRFDEFLTKLVGAVDAEVNYAFETSRYHELREQTRLDAVRKARDKARAMCEAVDATLGKLVSLRENGGYNPGPPMGVSGALAGDPASNGSAVVAWQSPDLSGGTLAPGTIAIRESVHAVFGIE